jgi:hypothetical protein
MPKLKRINLLFLKRWLCLEREPSQAQARAKFSSADEPHRPGVIHRDLTAGSRQKDVDSFTAGPKNGHAATNLDERQNQDVTILRPVTGTRTDFVSLPILLGSR